MNYGAVFFIVLFVMVCSEYLVNGEGAGLRRRRSLGGNSTLDPTSGIELSIDPSEELIDVIVKLNFDVGSGLVPQLAVPMEVHTTIEDLNLCGGKIRAAVCN